jgi:hypothetical protein
LLLAVAGTNYESVREVDALYPRCASGASGNEEPDAPCSAQRLGSDATWQQQDPQLPKGIWHFTDVPWLGFCIARPRKMSSVGPPKGGLVHFAPPTPQNEPVPDGSEIGSNKQLRAKENSQRGEWHLQHKKDAMKTFVSR